MLVQNFLSFISLNLLNFGAVVTCVVLLATWMFLKRETKPNKKKYSKEATIKAVVNETDVRSPCQSPTDITKISKFDQLDMKNPSTVKKYVQELRQQAYIKKEMSDEELQMENEAKNRQLAQIHALLNQEKHKFGGEMSFDELNAQMALYN
ncbi:uncharacterized protein LOC101238443 [Hydra vulgaris]|uniref:uncharacterized protein LOC101238443 n=1 Tax=Hydra vulgaris TaxID=6087 RepID=UPI0002B48875|nr:uncharacterized protein LOC101238443 [Hydra vulgaris]